MHGHETAVEVGSMSGDRQPGDGEPVDAPDHDAVVSRAEGRPPEEESSENPMTQAEVILEESETRLEEGAKESAPDDG
jgi:hypothetical protein